MIVHARPWLLLHDNLLLSLVRLSARAGAAVAHDTPACRVANRFHGWGGAVVALGHARTLCGELGRSVLKLAILAMAATACEVTTGLPGVAEVAVVTTGARTPREVTAGFHSWFTLEDSLAVHLLAIVSCGAGLLFTVADLLAALGGQGQLRLKFEPVGLKWQCPGPAPRCWLAEGKESVVPEVVRARAVHFEGLWVPDLGDELRDKVLVQS